jgi:hypothetical protein
VRLSRNSFPRLSGREHAIRRAKPPSVGSLFCQIPLWIAQITIRYNLRGYREKSRTTSTPFFGREMIGVALEGGWSVWNSCQVRFAK